MSRSVSHAVNGTSALQTESEATEPQHESTSIVGLDAGVTKPFGHAFRRYGIPARQQF